MAPPNDPRPAADADDESSIDELLRILKRVPLVGALVADLGELRALLKGRRLPRIAVVGRRGCGKSSLGNALLGTPAFEVGVVRDTAPRPQWVEIRHGSAGFRWLDTAGLHTRDHDQRRADVVTSLSREPPDVLVLASKALSVKNDYDEEAGEFAQLVKALPSNVIGPAGLVAVVTQCDELFSPLDRTPPYSGRALEDCEATAARAKTALESRGLVIKASIPTVTYWRRTNAEHVDLDWRWNIDRLASALFEAIPPEAQIETARAFSGSTVLRRRVAMRIVRASAGLALIIGSTPLPVGDIFVLSPLQAAMVGGVMLASGRPPNSALVAEWIASLGVNVGSGMLMREAARAAVKLVPGIGGTISGGVAAAGTFALGIAAIRYFIDGASLEEVRAGYHAHKNDEFKREQPEDSPKES